mmetsp:Transcript_61201/g.72659  ORF Transcript_61201/g.72659 Transcript_61201/m.72659 type:complete len:985 (+) Transcript_61201:104-3058(+)|eukprot:CAMPEP_0172491194 /NCGR_PEP_ID=MMETSP1066-20121228/21913_1 /TAXON_ID=671091 /ORGANISM="Coscinodiscus wailesii, Strain CCMP2513" /LENGTH=984 /DNA_ID=CAMNT_0013260109 /DNA_START=82 /DNA_END=3036 /DNA_ORIENTATION=-
MLICLQDQYDESLNGTSAVHLLGGKAASLQKLHQISKLSPHVPRGFVLTVEFFRTWFDVISRTSEFQSLKEFALRRRNDGKNETSGCDGSNAIATGTALCDELKKMILSLDDVLVVSAAQESVLSKLRNEISSWSGAVAAVRSSAPEEDGCANSFAGVFETKLGVTPPRLLRAVKECFASVFDYRAIDYFSATTTTSSQSLGGGGDDVAIVGKGLAVVVMEMVNSHVAGVAFSANPVNSDRDEMVVDSSWGLGTSVVDGSVEADHFVWDRIGELVVDQKVGSKTEEERLVLEDGGGGVIKVAVASERQRRCTLSKGQLKELGDVVGEIERAYGAPVDVEWAYAEVGGDNSGGGSTMSARYELRVLQARPITTLFCIDDNMMTAPGERRVLYYDFNIASEATTTSPFTTMDMDLYCALNNIVLSIDIGEAHPIPPNPKMLMFRASTRQYFNLSMVLKLTSTKSMAKQSAMLDPYLESLFLSQDCDRKKYRCKKLPKEINFRNAWWYFRKFPFFRYYRIGKKYISNPAKAKKDYKQMARQDLENLKKLARRGPIDEKGLYSYLQELTDAITPSLHEEMGALMRAVLPKFKKLNNQRVKGKTERDRIDADALCGGFEGDELMEKNIAMYRLARLLPESVWDEYNFENYHELARRIQSNIDGSLVTTDLPSDFLTSWKTFLNNYGYDGEDQLFVSSHRYNDKPEYLLAKLSHNVGDGINDPAVVLEKQVRKRREVMARQEQEAAKKWWYKPWARRRVLKQNELLEHVFWMRNAPKLHIAEVFAAVRQAVLKIEHDFISAGRLDEEGDIFHLTPDEVDAALKDSSLDLKDLIKDRKATYRRALNATVCPMLIDSRCRILQPNKHQSHSSSPNELIGTAVSPGVATGRARVVRSPIDVMKTGEVLVALVTGPSWTPLFVGAAAVVLQIGGVLQHGALCAREYGKPAVSGINDVLEKLETGMLLRVDGNTGVVTILKDDDEEKKDDPESMV